MVTTPFSPREATAAAGRIDELSIRWRQRIGALSLVLAPAGLGGSVAAYAWATRHGGDDYSGANALALFAQHRDLVTLATVCAMIGALLMVPAVLTVMQVLRAASPRLSLVSGSLMVLGYACYVGICMSNFTVLAMVERGGHRREFAAVLDASNSAVAGLWPFALFVLGNILGTALLAVAIWRSRLCAPWVAVAVLCWPVSHVVGLSLGSEWFELGGAILQLAGFAALARVVVRVPANAWGTDSAWWLISREYHAGAAPRA